MWLYTKNGYYSACENKDDSSLIHVRAQFKRDIEYLHDKMRRFAPSPIVETPYGDYRYRLDISRTGWYQFLFQESVGIDYPKFKPAVKDKSTNRKEAYLACFNEMMRAGREAHAQECYQDDYYDSSDNDYTHN